LRDSVPGTQGEKAQSGLTALVCGVVPPPCRASAKRPPGPGLAPTAEKLIYKETNRFNMKGKEMTPQKADGKDSLFR